MIRLHWAWFAYAITGFFAIGFIIASVVFEPKGYDKGQKDALNGKQKYEMEILYKKRVNTYGRGGMVKINAKKQIFIYEPKPDTTIIEYVPADTLYWEIK